MPKVTFLPMGKACDAAPGECLLDVAIRSDIPIQHACGGFCACTTCHVHVREGELDRLSPMEDEEDERIGSVDRLTPRSRLACQAKVLTEDVTVEIQNIDD